MEQQRIVHQKKYIEIALWLTCLTCSIIFSPHFALFLIATLFCYRLISSASAQDERIMATIPYEDKANR